MLFEALDVDLHEVDGETAGLELGVEGRHLDLDGIGTRIGTSHDPVESQAIHGPILHADGGGTIADCSLHKAHLRHARQVLRGDGMRVWMRLEREDAAAWTDESRREQ